MDQIYTSINNDNHNQSTACTALELQYCIDLWDWHFFSLFFVSSYWSEVNLIRRSCGFISVRVQISFCVCSDYSIINNRSQLIIPGLLFVCFFLFLINNQQTDQVNISEETHDEAAVRAVCVNWPFKQKSHWCVWAFLNVRVGTPPGVSRAADEVVGEINHLIFLIQYTDHSH